LYRVERPKRGTGEERRCAATLLLRNAPSGKREELPVFGGVGGRKEGPPGDPVLPG